MCLFQALVDTDCDDDVSADSEDAQDSDDEAAEEDVEATEDNELGSAAEGEQSMSLKIDRHLFSCNRIEFD